MFLLSNGHDETPRQYVMPGEWRPRAERPPSEPLLDGVRICEREAPFDLEQDQCVPNTFDDYANSTCWICQDTEKSHWDWPSRIPSPAPKVPKNEPFSRTTKATKK